MPAVGAGLCRPHIPAGPKGGPEEGWDGKEEGPPPPCAPRSPDAQCKAGERGRAAPHPGAEALAASRRADDSAGQEVSHPGTGQVRGSGPSSTPRTPAQRRGWGGRGWEGALLGAGAKLGRECRSRAAARVPRPPARGGVFLKERAAETKADPAPGAAANPGSQELGGLGGWWHCDILGEHRAPAVAESPRGGCRGLIQSPRNYLDPKPAPNYLAPKLGAKQQWDMGGLRGCLQSGEWVPKKWGPMIFCIL